MLDRVSQLAVVAARQAVGEARLDLTAMDRGRVGIFIGSGMGGALSTDEAYHSLYRDGSDRVKPFSVLTGMTNAPAAWIGIEYDVSGPSLTFSTACSSSAVSIGEAWLRLRSGAIDVALAGGSEAPLSYGGMKAWEALHTLASEDPGDASASCKPFSANRCGLVLGEGAAILVLEDWARAAARGASIHGELLGYGLSTDASHITRPTVAGQATTMRAALGSAGIAADAIESINAHGTGTQANDAVETAAIKEVFGERAYRIPVSATKAIHGHLLGASGALELALALLALQQDVLSCRPCTCACRPPTAIWTTFPTGAPRLRRTDGHVELIRLRRHERGVDRRPTWRGRSRLSARRLTALRSGPARRAGRGWPGTLRCSSRRPARRRRAARTRRSPCPRRKIRSVNQVTNGHTSMNEARDRRLLHRQIAVGAVGSLLGIQRRVVQPDIQHRILGLLDVASDPDLAGSASG